MITQIIELNSNFTHKEITTSDEIIIKTSNNNTITTNISIKPTAETTNYVIYSTIANNIDDPDIKVYDSNVENDNTLLGTNFVFKKIKIIPNGEINIVLDGLYGI